MTDEQRAALEAALRDLHHQAAFAAYNDSRRLAAATLRALEALSGIRAPIEKLGAEQQSAKQTEAA